MVKSSKNLVAIILLSGSFLAFCMSVTAQESGPPTTSQEQAMNQLNTVPKDFETEIIVADEKGRKRAEFLIEVYKSLASDPTIENVNKYVRDDYVQHSPMLPDGPQGLAMFFRSSVVQYGTEIDVHRIIVVGNYAVAHVNFRKLTTSDPDDLGMSAVDIYTFGPDGKLAEHWDAVQGVPTYSVNPHGMFIRVLKD
jgi:predicted SnoaL-like aldol condensation-catalyzing enzyme